MLVTKSLERVLNSCTTPSVSYHLTLCGVSSRIADMDISAQLLQVAIKRIDTDLPLPTYATAGSVGFDLLCREENTCRLYAIADIEK